jgi:hypothetical protein
MVIVALVGVMVTMINIPVGILLETACVYNDYVVYKAAEEQTQFWKVLQSTVLAYSLCARSHNLLSCIIYSYTENA